MESRIFRFLRSFQFADVRSRRVMLLLFTQRPIIDFELTKAQFY